MKTKLLALALFLCPIVSSAQTLDVKEFRGNSVARKMTNAQDACISGVRCVLLIRPELSVFALGTLPALGANQFVDDPGNVTGLSPGVAPVGTDLYRYVSNTGNDLNDGRFWATAKATVNGTNGACASLPNQDSTCTLTSGFGTIFIAPSFSGFLPSCFSSITGTRCPAVTVIGPALLHVASSIKTYGTFILGTNNSGYTFFQDGFQMTVQSGGPRAAGAILADSTWTLPDAAEGTAVAESGMLAGFKAAGVASGNCLMSAGTNTTPGAGLINNSGFGCNTHISFPVNTRQIIWNNGANEIAVTAAAATADRLFTWPDNPSGNVTTVIASGTATMTTALIATVACGTTVTVAATGAVTTDAIVTAFNANPGTTAGLLPIEKWLTTDNVNFRYCNPTSASQTPGAATLNWRVVR